MDDIDEEASFWKINPEQLRGPDDQDGIWPENLPAVRAFLAICTQWRWRPVGFAGARPVGLDYAAAKSGFDLDGIDVSPDLWADIRTIEAGILSAMAEEQT